MVSIVDVYVDTTHVISSRRAISYAVHPLGQTAGLSANSAVVHAAGWQASKLGAPVMEARTGISVIKKSQLETKVVVVNWSVQFRVVGGIKGVVSAWGADEVGELEAIPG